MSRFGLVRITGRQLRAARAFPGWTQEDLARKAHIAAGTIKRMEEAGADSIQCRLDTLEKLLAALERVVILGEDESVRPRPHK